MDVVIDVSYIYGVRPVDQASAKTPRTAKEATGGDPSSHPSNALSPYDECSSSAIKLNNDLVLYLREVNSYLALVCVIREESFARRALVDYNIDCLKSSLEKIVQLNNSTRTGSASVTNSAR